MPDQLRKSEAATILLVEDEDMVRNLVRATLDQDGFRVVEAADGPAAIRAVQGLSESAIDLLVTDLVMPEGLLDSPTTAFLAKPFAPADLVREVRALLGRRSSGVDPA